MRTIWKSVLIAVAILVGICALLVTVHMSMYHFDFVGLIMSLHGRR